MPVTKTSRFSLHRWDSGSDPFTRAQNDSDNVQIETLGAIFRTGLYASIGGASSASNVRSFYYATDQTILYFSDGTTWIPLNDFGEAGEITTIEPDASASAGTSTKIALANHVHAIATDVPVAIGTALSEGASTSFARANHVHELGVGSIDTANQFASGIVDTAALKATAGSEAVTTAVIRDDAVTTVKILNGNVTPLKINSTIVGATSGITRNVSTGVLSVNIDTDTIAITGNTGGVKANSITDSMLKSTALSEAVTTAVIRNGAVTTDKILNGNVTGLKLAAAVAGQGLVQNVSGALDIGAGTGITVDTNSIGITAGGINTTQLTDDAVTASKLNVDVAGAGLVQNVSGALDIVGTGGGITVSADSISITTGGITDAMLKATALSEAVTTAVIRDGAVTVNKIGDDAVTADKINADVAGAGLVQNVSGALDIGGSATITVSANSISVATGSIDTAALKATSGTEAVTAAVIRDDAVTAAKINADVAGAGLVQNVSGALDIGSSSTITVAADSISVTAGSIDTAALKATSGTEAVTAAVIRDDAVTAAKINADVAGAGLVQNVSGALDIGAGTGITVGTDSISITTGGITDSMLKSTALSEAVTTAVIRNGAVTTDKIAANAVTGVKTGAGTYRNATSTTTGGQVKYGTAAYTTLTGTYTAGDLYLRYTA